jgi:hypothetical protein
VSSQVEPQEEIEDVTGVLEPDAGLPVPSPSGAVSVPLPASPAAQAAAVAATGIVAGAATVAAVRRVRSHGLPSLRRSRKSRRPLQVLASRSFLVDIHLLDRG